MQRHDPTDLDKILIEHKIFYDTTVISIDVDIVKAIFWETPGCLYCVHFQPLDIPILPKKTIWVYPVWLAPARDIAVHKKCCRIVKFYVELRLSHKTRNKPAARPCWLVSSSE